MSERIRFTRNLGGILMACALLMAVTPATAAVCEFPTPASVQVNIHQLTGEVVMNNERTRDGLRRMQRQSGRASAFGSAWTPVGLTLTELKYQMRLKIEAIPISKSAYCARLTAVDAELGYDKLRVYIARKFRPGSCGYRSISDHEMTHVAVFRDALNRFYPQLQHRLQRAAEEMEPVRSASPDSAAEYLRKRLGATIKPLFLEMNRELDRNNAKLDTPERYRMEQANCPEW